MKKVITLIRVSILLLISSGAGAQSIDGVPIGANTPSTGKFTNLTLGTETISNFSGINDNLVKATPSDITPGELNSQIIAGSGINVDTSTDPNKMVISATGGGGSEDSADGVEITFAGEYQNALDLNGTSLFIGTDNPTVTLGGQSRAVLSKGTIAGTLQQVFVDLPSSLFAGNHKLKLTNSQGFSEGLVYLNEITSGGNDVFTKLLLHGDGSGNTFSDSSASSHVISAFGNATQSSAESKFGGSSMYFDGAVSYLIGPTGNSDFEMGFGDFTVDFWFKSLATGTQWTNGMVSYGTNIGPTSSFKVYGGTNLHGYIWDSAGSANNSTVTATSNTTDNQWHHVAFIRESNFLKLYIDGVKQVQPPSGEDINVSNIPTNDSSNATLTIGTDSAGNHFTGYIDEVRISKGIARWTSDFSSNLPTAPYN